MSTSRKNLSIKSWVLSVGIFFSFVVQAQESYNDLNSNKATFITSTAKKMVVTDPAQKIIVTSNNPQFTIILQTNPTTVYLWKLVQHDTNLLQLQHKLYQPPTKKKKLTGAPGYEVWTFQVKPDVFALIQNSITTNIILARVRPWLETKNSKLWQELINNNKITFTVEIIYADKTT